METKTDLLIGGQTESYTDGCTGREAERLAKRERDKEAEAGGAQERRRWRSDGGPLSDE